ncbi:MAG TPA: SDR family oxidoreductase [Candidatus Methylomirabilis sp.]|nr:SDR family oxidoreductase [Candidatus Methylomirabilis sp.]
MVTGGAGFIGSHLAEALVRSGHRVRILDNFATGARANLAAVAGAVELLEGDLRDPAIVERAVRGVEVIFHQAALASVARSLEDPATTHAVNTTGTLSLLLAARGAGVRRVVYASSSSVYGDSPTLPKREEMPTQPKSPYAISKLAGEQYCQVFAAALGLETVSLRYFNIFGPRQDPASPYAAVIPKFLAAMRRGERPVIFGDGKQSRDFTYVENAVRANLLAAAAPGASGEVINVACGARITLLELVDHLNRLLGTHLTPSFAPPRTGDVLHSQADLARAAALLGYRPTVDFTEGLARTAAAEASHG